MLGQVVTHQSDKHKPYNNLFHPPTSHKSKSISSHLLSSVSLSLFLARALCQILFLSLSAGKTKISHLSGCHVIMHCYRTSIRCAARNKSNIRCVPSLLAKSEGPPFNQTNAHTHTHARTHARTHTHRHTHTDRHSGTHASDGSQLWHVTGLIFPLILPKFRASAAPMPFLSKPAPEGFRGPQAKKGE